MSPAIRVLGDPPFMALVAFVLTIAGCGGGGGDGGSDSSASIADAQKDCYFQYDESPPAEGSGADPLLGSEWHLAALGVPAAWSSAKGEGTRIAIVDDAVETLHEDLYPNVAAYRNYRSGISADARPLPCAQDDTHGTSVAGIAAARDGNALGVAGVAPRASLAAYNALAEGAGTEAAVSDALRRDEAITTVYNNSWGAPDEQGLLRDPGSLFRSTIRDGLQYGRSGKGSIYVFPAGNGGCGGSASSDCVRDDSNYDGYANTAGVIAACGVDENDRKPPYAEPGANVLVCGASGGSSRGITTTVVRNGYTSSFGGTSASTPMVSGVAALLLEVAPALTWRDVRLILATTARPVDTGASDWQTNRAGLRVNPYYGFGVVDAGRAVATAKTWPSVGANDSLRKCSFPRAVAAPIPDLGAVSDTVAVNSAACPITSIELVEVEFDAEGGYSGDLQIELQRSDAPPSSTTLARSRVCRYNGTTTPCGDYRHWVFTSVANLNESAVGSWTLKVSDLLAQDTTTWNTWKLTIWGR
ncbi:MAG: S8 family serine peptidase [Burkholderiaceae bacterium]|nr:S8 family serine peptidase [Burkholderiaceae bacterium]